MAIGYRVTDLNVAMGNSGNSGGSLLYRGAKGVHVDTAARVREIYDQLWDTPGPSEQTRRRAVKWGWRPPMAWDDAEMDVPEARPAPKQLPRRVPATGKKLDVAAETEEIIRLMNAGLQISAIATRLGVNRRRVQRRLERLREAS